MRTYWLINEQKKLEDGLPKSKEITDCLNKSYKCDENKQLTNNKTKDLSTISTPPGSPNRIPNQLARWNITKNSDVTILPPPPPSIHHRRCSSQRRRVANYYSNSLSILIENNDFQNLQLASPNISSGWPHVNERYPSAPIIEFK